MLLAALASNVSELDCIQSLLYVVDAERYTLETLITAPINQSDLKQAEMMLSMIGVKMTPSQTGWLRLWDLRLNGLLTKSENMADISIPKEK